MQVQLIEAGFCKHPGYFAGTDHSLAVEDFAATVAVMDHPQKGIILFDTGYSMAFHQATRYFPEKLYALTTPVTISPERTAVAQLGAMGIRPQDVRHVILSHFHADHVSGLSDFPKARYICVGQAYEALKSLSRIKRLKAAFLQALFPADFSQRLWSLDLGQFQLQTGGPLAGFRAFDLFTDQRIQLVDLPGHALGHIGLFCQSDRGPFFFVGDAAWRLSSLEKNILPSQIAKLVTADWSTYRRTYQQLHDCHHRMDIHIVPCHCERSVFSAISSNSLTLSPRDP